MALFDVFPVLEDEELLLTKMTQADLDALEALTGSELVYRYIPPFLYRKSRGNLRRAIDDLGGRDFEKQKMIIMGIYRRSAPQTLLKNGFIKQPDGKEVHNWADARRPLRMCI